MTITKKILESVAKVKNYLKPELLTVISFISWKMMILLGSVEEVVDLFEPKSSNKMGIYKKFLAIRRIVSTDIMLKR